MLLQTNTSGKEEKMSFKNMAYAKNLSEVFYQLKNNQELQIIGGCTSLKELPDSSLSIRNIPELKNIEKRERFFDFGAAVTLSDILYLGKKNLPPLIFDAVHTIATHTIRNLATIGGNICAEDCAYRHTLYAPLLALDAKLEFQKNNETEIIPLTKFNGIPQTIPLAKLKSLKEGESSAKINITYEKSILTKIHIPAEEWDVEIFKRLGPSHVIDEQSASFAFLANSQKGKLSNLRIAFAGHIQFRNQKLENKLIGANLPLADKDINDLLSEIEIEFDKASAEATKSPMLKKQFLNLVRYSLEQLT